MRILRSVFALLLLLSAGCAGTPGWQAEAGRMIRDGRFAGADSLIDAVHAGALPSELRQADSLRELMRRLRIEFRYTLPEIARQVRSRVSDTVSDAQIRRWTQDGKLEMRMIDGEPRYFSRAASNLVRLAPELSALRPDDGAAQRFRAAHAAQAVLAADSLGACTNPVRMTIRYTLSVHPGAVSPGDTVRCWLPCPQQGLPRQTDVDLLGTCPEKHVLSPDDSPHRSIYFEQTAGSDGSAVFAVSYRITCRAQYFDPERLAASVRPYDTSSELYRTWTAERPPHTVFHGLLSDKARELAAGDANPVRVAGRIYDWIEANFPWAGAIEYGVIPDIPAYVLEAGHGDCGQVSLLLIAMLRSVGIPARWESGWMLHPGEVGLHDWASVYYEGVGWVPVDVSFGTITAGKAPSVRNFYKTGLDSYRLVVNSDYGRPFTPAKRHMRSEPVDFQRGEVETASRNLYFDQWDYHMDVDYE